MTELSVAVVNALAEMKLTGTGVKSDVEILGDLARLAMATAELVLEIEQRVAAVEQND
jgi:hypothetical protein